MREGKKERGAPRRHWGSVDQSFHELVYFYTGARAWALPAGLSFLFLGDLPCSFMFVGLARLSNMLFCMAPTWLTTRE